ncbi:MAG TPA: glycoside hydrolase family 3 N-terminal domain-containing protein, partial [Trebonia sp.]|nr:glycoside hydrolase family 3 N-terminal domain-containing protein [Trebonia sp.]
MTEPFKDTRLPTGRRVEDLLARMTVEEKAGLLFHTVITPGPGGSVTQPPSPSYDGEPSAAYRVRHQLISHFNVQAMVTDVREWAGWHNRLQELAAQTRLGIPVTLSTDPRHAFSANPNASIGAGAFSQWPEPIGLAAIGDPAEVERFGDIARREYLATGFRVALHPMADLATEPRWARISGTFGEDAEHASRLLAAYVRGFQGSRLGLESVAVMVKHFPGGGPQKDGEDPHFEYGKEQVYPGRNFGYHLRPFAAAIRAGAAQVMPYYAMPAGTEYEAVGFGFNRDVIHGILRERLGFDGVVCTDWGIIADTEFAGELFAARAWGAEHLSPEERLLKSLDAGVDQFGGTARPELIVHLVRSGRLDERRVDVSARRILRDKFTLGLFDHRYLDPEASSAVAGCPAFVAAGLAAQRASLTLLKNDSPPGREQPILPLPAGSRVFTVGIDARVAAEYFTVATSMEEADYAVVRLPAPYEERPGTVERFFHAGTLEFDPATLNVLMPVLERLPAVVVVNLERPAILTRVAAAATALAGEFGAADGAVLDVLTGRDRPRGRLPFDLPSSMAEVLAQRPDVPFDLPHPLYRFGHGLA